MPVSPYGTDDIFAYSLSLDQIREAKQRDKKTTQNFMKRNQEKRGGRKRK